MKRFLVLAVLTLVAVSALSSTSVGVFQAPRVLFEDRFNSDESGWKEDPVWSYSDDDQYRMFLRNAGTTSHSDVPDGTLFGRSQYCVEVDMKILLGSALAEDGFVGFYIGGESTSSRAIPSATWFGFGILGSLVVWDVENTGRGISLDLVQFLPFEFVDPNEFKTLRLEVNSPQVVVSVNGEELATISRNGVGEMGFMAFSFDDPNLNARFDNITVWDVCPEDN